jgi:3-methylfumaryl-CoA hydratase
MHELQAWVGREERARDRVDAAAVARWCATLDAPAAKDEAPPGFHWCLAPPAAATAALGEDGHPHRGGFLPPTDLPRRMWAGSEVAFLAPLPIGAAVERRSAVAAVTPKAGRGGRLVFVAVEHVTAVDGVDAVLERQNIVYREAGAAVPLPPVGTPDLGEWPWVRTVVPDEVRLFRYSALTFNAHRIHYDRPFAERAEGYPGLVVHGPLMATWLLDLCRREGVVPARFAFRAVAPAFAGQPLHLVGRPGADGVVLSALGADGRVVVEAQAVPA